MSKKNSKLQIIFFLLFSLIFSSLLYMTTAEKESRIQTLLQHELKSVNILYSFILKEYERRADTTYKIIQNDAKVIELFSKGLKAKGKDRDRLRDELNTLLRPKFLELKELGLANFNFMTPQTDVFLRLHQPNIHSDSLLGIRHTYEYTNKTHKPARGFEQGRLLHAFSNSYPILDKNKSYIGALGVGFSSKYMEKVLNKSLKVHSHFLIDKNLVEDTIFDVAGASVYVHSPEYKEYLLFTSDEKDHIETDEYSNIISSLKDTIASKMQSKKDFALPYIGSNGAVAITFLAISDFKESAPVAYLVSYQESPEIFNINKNYFLLNLAIFFTTLIILIFIYRSLQQKIALEDQKELYELVFENSSSSVLIIDIESNTFIDCNQAAIDILKCDSKADVLGLDPAQISPEFQADGRRSSEKSEEMNVLSVQNGSHTFEWEHLDKTGEAFWVEVILTPIIVNDKKVLHVVWKDISDRKKSDLALTNSYNLLTTIIDTVPLRIFWKDRSLNYLGCNTLFAKDAGKSTPGDIIGKSDYDLVWKDQAEIYRSDDRSVIDSKTSKLFYDETQTGVDGKEICLRVSKVPLYNDQNEPIGILGVYEDITKHKSAETALKDSRAQLQAIIENEPESVTLMDRGCRLIDINPAGLEILQADTLKQALEYPFLSYVLPQGYEAFMALHKEVMKGNSGALEFELQGLKGERRWLDIQAVPMRDSDDNVTMMLGISRDITQRKKSEKHIEYMVNHDALTDLPNRAKLDEKLRDILHLAKRNQWGFALMFLDLDHFKDINDTLGHDVGDNLLIELSRRIQSLMREEDTVARFGGDEFILLLPNTDTNGAQEVAQKLLKIIQNPFTLQQHNLTVSASIGIALYPADGLDKETLFKNADISMYRAKDEGRNSYSFFTQEMQTISRRKQELSNALHQALKNNELHLVYQPQLSLKTGYLFGAEALLRWEHPELGIINPEEFIPIAENNGLILPIGEWVIRTATQQLKDWMQRGMKPIVISVNLSSLQFSHPTLPKLVTQILESTGLKPEYLELELTEGVTIRNPQGAVDIMNDLSKRGVRMSIDDFGTGYSSLNYLKKFKIYRLKIDKSFVRDISTDPEDKAIVGAIIHMADSLGLNTIAEGIETIEQLDYLREQGCDEGQGYYYDKPLLANEFEYLYRMKGCLK